MPTVKLSRVVYVPKNPKPSDKGSVGNLSVDGQTYPLPAGSRNCDIDVEVMKNFLDAITKHNVELKGALEQALKDYTAGLA